MASVGRRITDAHERRELKEYNGFLLAEAYEYLGKVSEWLKEALTQSAEYFEGRADADGDSEGFYPNEEMRLLTLCEEALPKTSKAKEVPEIFEGTKKSLDSLSINGGEHE